MRHLEIPTTDEQLAGVRVCLDDVQDEVWETMAGILNKNGIPPVDDHARDDFFDSLRVYLRHAMKKAGL